MCLLLILLQAVHADDVDVEAGDAAAEASAPDSTVEDAGDRAKRQSNYQYAPFELPNNNFVSFGVLFC